MRSRSLSSLSALLVVAGVLLLPTGVLAQGGSPAASSPAAGGAATPEDAVAAYVAGIAAGDVDAILASTVVDRMAAGFDFQAQAERLQAMALTTGLAPAQYPLFAQANRYQQASLILGQVRSLVYGLLSDETIDGSIIAPVDAERAAAFVAAVDPSRLAGLRLIDARLPSPDMTTGERYLGIAASIAATYGADEMVDRLALVELDGQTYGVGFTLLRYGDQWGVSSQNSAIAGTPAIGTAMPMSRAEFDAATGG